MCKTYFDKRLSEEIKEEEIIEIAELAPKVETWIKEGNKKKIMKLKNSKILHRIHLHGRHRRMVFSYIEGIVRVYEVFTESDDEKKIKFYDNLCNNESKYTDFIDVTPQKIEVSKEKINALRKVLEALDNSAMMAIPKKGKIELNDLMMRFEKQKWIRKYSKMKQLFYKLRHDKNGDKKLMKILKDIKKRDLEEKLINNLSKLNSSALQKEVNARFENKKQIKISEELMRRIK